MKPDCPNCQNNDCRHINELQTIDPIVFKVSQEEWEQLNKALNEPPKVSEGLRRLFGKHEGKDND